MLYLPSEHVPDFREVVDQHLSLQNAYIEKRVGVDALWASVDRMQALKEDRSIEQEEMEAIIGSDGVHETFAEFTIKAFELFDQISGYRLELVMHAGLIMRSARMAEFLSSITLFAAFTSEDDVELTKVFRRFDIKLHKHHKTSLPVHDDDAQTIVASIARLKEVNASLAPEV